MGVMGRLLLGGEIMGWVLAMGGIDDSVGLVWEEFKARVWSTSSLMTDIGNILAFWSLGLKMRFWQKGVMYGLEVEDPNEDVEKSFNLACLMEFFKRRCFDIWPKRKL